VLPEEMGGPFVESLAADEFSLSDENARFDALSAELGGVPTNPLRSALPQAVGPLAIAGLDEELEDEETDDDSGEGIEAGAAARAVDAHAEPASRIEPSIHMVSKVPNASRE
jgi:hypothetical protein